MFVPYSMLGTGWVAKLTLKDRTVTVLLTNHHVLGNLEIARSADTEYQFAYLYPDSERNPAVIYGNELIPDNKDGFHTCHISDEVSCTSRHVTKDDRISRSVYMQSVCVNLTHGYNSLYIT